MELQHVNAKIFVDGELPVDPEEFIEVFHRWTAAQSLDELLIDVADYRHVPSGPGVVLVGHQADYALDNAGNRYGLLYNRKEPLDGTNAGRLAQALGAAAKACELLEAEFAADNPLKFSRQQLQIVINDRALAPNTDATYEAVEPELKAFFEQALGHGDFRIERESEPRRRFGVTVTSDKPFDLSKLAQAVTST